MNRRDPFRPIDMQDVRLAMGEGRLTIVDVLTGVNAELARRRSMRGALDPGPTLELREIISRQRQSYARTDAWRAANGLAPYPYPPSGWFRLADVERLLAMAGLGDELKELEREG